MALQLRRAGLDDLETLVAIQRESAVAAFGHVFPPDRYPFPTDAIRDAWAEAVADPDVEAVLGEIDGEPVALVSVGHSFLRTLYVVPRHWGEGIGSTLLGHGLVRLRARGCEVARLWTLSENHRGRRFYERRGWELTGATRVVPFPPHPIDVEYAIHLTQQVSDTLEVSDTFRGSERPFRTG